MKLKKAYHLNKIKKGSKIEFLQAKTGVVKSIWKKCGVAGSSNISSMRLHIIHEGSESFHTYRHDGKSTICFSHDMISIDGKRILNKEQENV